jgi:hypothetical protein
MIQTENLITYNAGGTKDLVAELLRMVREHNPAKIELQEVADRRDGLAEFADLTGYLLTQYDLGDHSASLASLTRPDVPNHGRSDIDRLTPRTFVGRLVAGARKDGYTKAKWLLRTRPQFLDLSWVIASTHIVPSHFVKRARRLARLQVETIVALIAHNPRMVLVAGDFNDVPKDRWKVLEPLAGVLDLFTAPSRYKRAIDHWWVPVKRLGRYGITVTVQALKGYGSDHRPVMITLTREVPDPPVPEQCPVTVTVPCRLDEGHDGPHLPVIA